MASLAERHEALIQWVQQAGGQLHHAVEVYHDELTKGSLRVKPCTVLGSDESVVTLPLSCSLSYLNAIAGHPKYANATPSAISKPQDGEYFSDEFLSKTPAHVVGRFLLMQEYRRGHKSAWWPYIRTLPQPEHMASMLPVTWPPDDVEFLRGTNAYIATSEIKSTLRKEHRQAMSLLPSTLKFEYTRMLYYWAYCIFTTRSFRPSLIIPEEDLCVLPCTPDDFSVLLPLFDVGNHSPFAKVSWVTDNDIRTCSLKSGQTYSEGQQIYNNYGTKTNAELLLGYGFILPESEEFHNDYVHVKTRANPEAGDLNASHIVSLRPIAHASSATGQSRLLDPSHTLCIAPLSHFQDSLIAALYESMNSGSEGASDPSLTDIMQGRISGRMLEKMLDVLATKLSIDLEEIEMHDPPYEATSPNQRLAAHYRDQCKKVLCHALGSLSDPEYAVRDV
ncbi:SET domain-containing protein [Xylariaceae sp. FL1019]|nr:SET domain-containing protein [Xylariaceae sp. FL1019]